MMNKREEADRTIFVGNLDSGAREEILFELFLQAGPLTKVHIAKDKDGRQKTYGFICFKHTESVPYAITLLNGIRLYGRPLNLQYRSGSSHTADPSTSHPGVDNSQCRAPEDNCRSTQFQDGPSSSLFLTPPYSTSNSFSNPDPYYWQAIMNTYALQQYHINSQMVQQQQQQQQYYQAMAQQMGPPAQMSHFSPMQDFMARPPQPPWDNLQQRGPDQDHGNCDDDSGQEGESISDNRTREKLRTASKHREHQYKKHKSKKKKY
ncbi:splicing regulator RBM11-like [Heptranchias perlo]|uniref:splicing regulator RBM11-like n=1 Tax=Heptranchias perlo TaxID=212740 RepID=UPI003559F1DB